MLSRKKLEASMVVTGLHNIQQAESDYLQHLILSRLLSSGNQEKLIFKGGTALQKLGITDRFSIDLDFTASSDMSDLEISKLVSFIKSELNDYGIKSSIKTEFNYNSISIKVTEIEGPIYSDTSKKKSMATVRIDVSRREIPVLGYTISSIIPKYDDIMRYNIKVMSVKEMLAEKIRAIVTRGQPRDLYDFWILLNKGYDIDYSLLRRKLAIVNANITADKLLEAIKRIEPAWQIEMKELLLTRSSVPDFSVIIDAIGKLLESKVFISIEFEHKPYSQTSAGCDIYRPRKIYCLSMNKNFTSNLSTITLGFNAKFSIFSDISRDDINVHIFQNGTEIWGNPVSLLHNTDGKHYTVFSFKKTDIISFSMTCKTTKGTLPPFVLSAILER